VYSSDLTDHFTDEVKSVLDIHFPNTNK
jgi:hypothetical protein